MNKKAQVTIIITIGLLILFAVFSIIFLKKSIKQPLVAGDYVNEVEIFVNNCLSRTAANAVNNITYQGGYYIIPNWASQYKVSDTLFWYKDGQNLEPFLTTIQQQLELYFKDHVNECLDFEPFTKRGIQIFAEPTIQNVTYYLYDNDVNVKVKHQIIVKNVIGQSAKLDEFFINLPIDIKKAIMTGHDVVNKAYYPSFSVCEPLGCNDNMLIKVSYPLFSESDFNSSTLISISSKNDLQQKKGYNYTLRFLIQKRLNESFGNSPLNLKTAVVYQKIDSMMPPPLTIPILVYPHTTTFADSALATLKEVTRNAYDEFSIMNCPDPSNFVDNIDSYDVLLMLGGTEWKIYEPFTGNPVLGCHVFPNPSGEKVNKWVESNNLVWINSWESSAGYSGNYSGELPKKDYLRFPFGALEPIEVSILGWDDDIINKLIVPSDHSAPIFNYTNPILHCPNEIAFPLNESYTFSFFIKQDVNASIVMGNSDKMKLWTANWGNGSVIVDNYILKENLFQEAENRGHQINDIKTLGIAKKYYENAMYHLLTLASRSKHIAKQPITSYCEDSSSCQHICCNDSLGILHTNYDFNRCVEQNGQYASDVCDIQLYCT